MTCASDFAELEQCFSILIDRFDLHTVFQEIESIPSGAGGHIQCLAFRESRELLQKERSRQGINRVPVLGGRPGSFETDPDRAGDHGQRGMQLSQPDADPFNRKFGKEHRYQSFHETFE